ncbi:MAG: DUF4222 domain-containing protein [Candidatus Symbiopectobacterium sp. Dall1.0]|nr:DUF4222 domain-containing protein [Candidatus Symbiopectobacterium sp. Dall1.0]
MPDYVSVPLPGQRYKDKYGDLVTIDYVEINHVYFFRDGYYGLCFTSLERFNQDFMLLDGGQNA